MAKNELQVILSAKTDGIEKSLAGVDARVRKTAKGIEGYLAESGAGAESLQDAIDSVEFGAIAEDAKAAAKDSTKAFSKTGDDLKKSFDSVKKTGLPEGFDKAKAASSEFASKANTDLGKVKSGFQEAKEALGKFIDKVDGASLGALSDGAGKLADSVSGVSDVFAESATEARKLTTELNKAFDDPAKVEKFTASAKNLKGQFEGLESDEIVLAIKYLEKFGQASEENLTRVANIAQTTGKAIDDIAEPYAEFFASAAKGQDIGAFEELRVQIGVGVTELRKFGAEVNSNNELVANTPTQIKAANDALKAYIDSQSRFSNVSERSQDNIAKVNTEIDNLKLGIGEGTNAFKDQIAEGILPYIKGLNSLSDETKSVVGTSITVTGGLTQAGAKIAEVGAFGLIAANQLKTLTAGMTFVVSNAALATAGMVAMGAGILAGVAGVALITVEFAKMRRAINDANDAQNTLFENQKKGLEADKDRLRLSTQSIDAIKKEAAAIEDAGKRRALLGDAILGKEAAAAIARKKGQDDLAKSLTTEAALLKGARAGYDGDAAAVAKASDDAAKAVEDRFERSRVAFNQFKTDLGRGLFDSNKKALTDLEAIAGGLNGESLKEAQVEIKKLQKTILGDELNTLKERTKLGELTVEQASNSLQSLLSLYGANSDDRRAIEKDFTEFQKGELDARFQLAQEFAAKDLDLQRSALDLRKQKGTSGIDDEIASLEEKVAKEQDVFGEIKKQTDARAALLKSYVDEEAALDKLAVKQEAASKVNTLKNKPEEQAKVLQQAAEQELQIDQRTALAKADIDRQAQAATKANLENKTKFKADQAKKELDLDKQAADLRKQIADDEQATLIANLAERRRILEDEASRGVDNSAKMTALAKEEASVKAAGIQKTLALEEAKIALELKGANAGASQAQQAINNQKAALDILRLRNQAQQDSKAIIDTDLQTLKEQTAELVKQKQLLEDATTERKKGATFKGGAQTVEEAFGSNASGLGVSRKDRAKTEDGKTAKDLQKEIDRNNGIINSRENAAKKDGGRFSKSSAAPIDAVVAAATAPLDPNSAQIVALLTQLVAATKDNGKRQPDRRSSNDGQAFSKRFDRTDGIIY